MSNTPLEARVVHENGMLLLLEQRREQRLFVVLIAPECDCLSGESNAVVSHAIWLVGLIPRIAFVVVMTSLSSLYLELWTRKVPSVPFDKTTVGRVVIVALFPSIEGAYIACAEVSGLCYGREQSWHVYVEPERTGLASSGVPGAYCLVMESGVAEPVNNIIAGARELDVWSWGWPDKQWSMVFADDACPLWCLWRESTRPLLAQVTKTCTLDRLVGPAPDVVAVASTGGSRREMSVGERALQDVSNQRMSRQRLSKWYELSDTDSS